MHKNSRRLTSPLSLLAHVRPDKLRFTSAAWIGVGLAALGLTLLGGRFLFAPGIAIDLPSIANTFEAGLPTAQVLTIGQNGTFFFEGRVLNLETLQSALKTGHSSREGFQTLLIKGDKATPLQTFLKVCKLAHEEGFNQVQVATIPANAALPWAIAPTP